MSDINLNFTVNVGGSDLNTGSSIDLGKNSSSDLKGMLASLLAHSSGNYTEGDLAKLKGRSQSIIERIPEDTANQNKISKNYLKNFEAVDKLTEGFTKINNECKATATAISKLKESTTDITRNSRSLANPPEKIKQSLQKSLITAMGVQTMVGLGNAAISGISSYVSAQYGMNVVSPQNYILRKAQAGAAWTGGAQSALNTASGVASAVSGLAFASGNPIAGVAALVASFAAAAGSGGLDIYKNRVATNAQMKQQNLGYEILTGNTNYNELKAERDASQKYNIPYTTLYEGLSRRYGGSTGPMGASVLPYSRYAVNTGADISDVVSSAAFLDARFGGLGSRLSMMEQGNVFGSPQTYGADSAALTQLKSYSTLSNSQALRDVTQSAPYGSAFQQTSTSIPQMPVVTKAALYAYTRAFSPRTNADAVINGDPDALRQLDSSARKGPYLFNDKDVGSYRQAALQSLIGANNENAIGAANSQNVKVNTQNVKANTVIIVSNSGSSRANGMSQLHSRAR